MDAHGLELTCPCGYENFERIVVQRKPHPPLVTDFVACVGCKTMYRAPRCPAWRVLRKNCIPPAVVT